MTSNSYFHFKHFKLRNEQAAFKINTDGVLLAVWANIQKAQTILDIGSGTGVIGVICQHKNPTSQITSIDIDLDSVQESNCNYQLNSVNGLCINVSLEDFKTDVKFDHIICNPPYFENDSLPSDSKLAISKHATHFSHKTFWAAVEKLTKADSLVSLVLPISLEESYRKRALEKGFFLSRKLSIHARVGQIPNRVLLEFSKNEHFIYEEASLALRSAAGDTYTQTYKDLLKDYYLKF